MQFPELKYSFPIKTTKLPNNISIAYWEEGDGKDTLLFIHGLASYIPAWSKNIPELKKHFHCIAIDLPGYGKSNSGVHSGNMNYYVEIISQFINELKLSNVSLVGHSMGGQIVLSFALNYPKQVNRLILVAPAGFETFNQNEINWIKKNYSFNSMFNITDDQMRINYSNNFFQMPGETEFMIQDRIRMKSSKNFADYCRVVINSLYSMLENPIFEKLKLIETQTLILFGKNDVLIPHPMLHKNLTTEEIACTGSMELRNAKLVLYNNCGHFIQFEKPNEFNRAILEFFDLS